MCVCYMRVCGFICLYVCTYVCMYVCKCYQDRLKLCNLESLKTRRLHVDLILMYKIINSTIHVDLHNRVSISYSITRGNKYKLNKYHAKLDIRKYFFAFRTVNIWNFLHNDIC